MKKLTTLFSSMFVVAVILTACGNNDAAVNSNNEEDESNESMEKIEIMTTLFPLEDFANRIGGEYVSVNNMVPVGADAHSFEPTANQMIEVAEADLFIYNGADFEGFADSIRDAVDSHDVTILTASEGIDLIGYDHSHDQDDHDYEENNHGHENDDHNNDENNHVHENNDHDDEENNHGHENNEENNHGHENDDHNNDENNHAHENNDHDDEENNHGHENNEENNHGHENDDHNNDENNHAHENNDHDDNNHEHGDEDPHVWLDPIRSMELAENIKDALVEISPELEDEFTANFEELKLDLEELDNSFQQMTDDLTTETIIVSHAGYGYWEERYGIKQTAISGLSPTNEPSIQQIEEVIDLMESNDVYYVMFEQNIPTTIAETVREQVGAEELWLHNLEALTEENIENDDDYFSIMEQNIETLRTALQ